MKLSSDSASQKKQIYLYGISFLFILVTAFFLEKYIALQNHNLLQTQKWHSLKSIRSLNFPGGTSNLILTDRATLNQEVLHLDLWGGYNDLIYREPIQQLENYQIHFNLNTPQSFLLIYLDCSTEACWVYRASRNPLFKSGLLLIAHSGQYLEKRLSEHVYQFGDQVFEMKHEAADSYKIYINHQIEHEVKYNSAFKFMRFSSGLSDVTIQKISLQQVSKPLQNIDFKVAFHFEIYSCLFFILFIGAYILISKKVNPQAVASILAAILTMSFTLFKFNQTISFLIQNINSQSAYLTDISTFSFLGLPAVVHTIDQKHFAVIDSNQEQVFFKSDLSSYFENKKIQDSFKIAVVGGSQAWGVGATAAEKTWASDLVKKLKPHFKKPLVAINFSQIGARAEDFKVRAHAVKDFKPQLILIHFGYNDSNTKTADLEKTLKSLFLELKKLGIQIVLSLEPINADFSASEVSQSLFLENFSTLHGVDVLHSTEKFNEAVTADSGLLWIDENHLTDYGQEVLAQYLAQELIQLKLF